jgi:selenocysteine-specific elongation factor
MTGGEAVRHLVLGTAGHIDHGKSSLIKALTGTDPDRLTEEKARGITIELGFAELDLSDGLSLGVVDVPGHERFVRQMIAGATGIDIALLCIAADDGVMPQTVEHLAVLELLAVPRMVVALTKTDIVEADWLEVIQADVHDFLAATSYAGSEIVPLSSRSGEGLEQLRRVLAGMAKDSRHQHYGEAARMPIDRVFSIKGHGTVATGTLWSGQVAVDDELEILPSGLRARVRSVQIHGRQTQTATAGNRVALNLNALKRDELAPGDMLVKPQSLRLSDRFDAFVSYIGVSRDSKALKSGSRLRIAHGTREVSGRLLLMDGLPSLEPGSGAFAQIRLDLPLPLSWKDRFIIRANTHGSVRVIGGGIALACHPRRRTTLGSAERSFLDALLKGNEPKVLEIAFKSQVGLVSVQMLADATGISSRQAAEYLDGLYAGQQARKLTSGQQSWYASAQSLQKWLAALENALLGFHIKNPEQTGIAKGALEQLVGWKGQTGSFDALLLEAQRLSKLDIAASQISHLQAGGKARELESQAEDKLLALLAAAGSAPPALGELIGSSGMSSTHVYRALGALEKRGLVGHISKEFYFAAAALDGLENAVREYLSAHQSASVAELRDVMQTSRKYAVPLLEYLDAKGVTRRNGDLRSLKL